VTLICSLFTTPDQSSSLQLAGMAFFAFSDEGSFRTFTVLKAALEAFIEEFRLEATLDEVVAKARCSKCWEKIWQRAELYLLGVLGRLCLIQLQNRHLCHQIDNYPKRKFVSESYALPTQLLLKL